MSNDILSPALIASMVGNLSVPDLIRTMETFKQSGQTALLKQAMQHGLRKIRGIRCCTPCFQLFCVPVWMLASLMKPSNSLKKQ